MASPVSSALNITASVSPFVVKASPGRIHMVFYANGNTSQDVYIYDANSAAGAVAANQIFYVNGGQNGNANSSGPYVLDWPCANGIVVSVGGGSAAISFD
jgi:hypothetical protein